MVSFEIVLSALFLCWRGPEFFCCSLQALPGAFRRAFVDLQSHLAARSGNSGGGAGSTVRFAQLGLPEAVKGTSLG